MSVVLITGSAGLVGTEAVLFFAEMGFDVVGIDNDMRAYFFGELASNQANQTMLQHKLKEKYTHYNHDIRDEAQISKIFQHYGQDIDLVIHTAAQPSHDWAATEPHTDFTINANGTLNLLEATRKYAPQAVFIFTSTNKVYGNSPNQLPLIELDTRWELPTDHIYAQGISETMSIDQNMHSLFGASKVSADVMTQEYGRYFDLQTTCFRAGCITGPNHAGVELHGFIAYLMKCTVSQLPYTVLGYKGKQVRDNIHCNDLVQAFYSVYKNPRIGEVYNIGGGRFSNCSLLEAIDLSQKVSGQELTWIYSDKNRKGDHIWWISNNNKFQMHYPDWQLKYNTELILEEIFDKNQELWHLGA